MSFLDFFRKTSHKEKPVINNQIIFQVALQEFSEWDKQSLISAAPAISKFLSNKVYSTYGRLSMSKKDEFDNIKWMLELLQDLKWYFAKVEQAKKLPEDITE